MKIDGGISFVLDQAAAPKFIVPLKRSVSAKALSNGRACRPSARMS